MKLEKLNTKDKAYKFFLYGLIYVVVLLLIFNFVTSRAKYRVTQSIPLVRGTITSSMYDFHIVGIYLKTSSGDITGKDGTKYKETDEIPGNNYKINETNSYCYIGTEDNIDTEAKLYTNSKGEHIISNLTKKDNCYLYFDGNGAASDIILADKEIKPSTGGMFNVPDGTTTSGVIYETEDDDGTSYYFRGNPTDNWVYFGGYYWRIIRINGDGSVRMIYQGTTLEATGETTQIGTGAFNINYNDNMYVGYWYTSGNIHGLGTASNIYTTLNNWFAGSNIKQGSDYYQYIDPDAGFCNDRTPSTTTTSTVIDGVNVGNGSGGTGTTTTYYAAYLRLAPGGSAVTTSTAAVTPSLKCTNSDDLFTYSGANKGNKKLANPVGLITADEVTYGGLVYGTAPSSRTNYLDTGSTYWTMSPYYFNSGYAIVFDVYSGGFLGFPYVAGTFGVRPVINLKADIELSGNGTTSSPYKIKEKTTIANKEFEVLERTSENKDFNVSFTEETTGKIYKAPDDDGTSYYFAGSPTDNWVYFGGYYWRIIRINGDGTIRMIYQGTTATATGATTNAVSNIAYNTNYNDNIYVGYWYGTSGQLRGLTTPSNIYTTLNDWFAASNIKQGSSYYQYIDPNAGFCNDREPSTTNIPTVNNGVNVGNGSGGTGTTATSYGAYLRLRPDGSTPSSSTTAITPSLKCSNSDDLFTYSGANQGNMKLANPVGLITADEVAFGGLVFFTSPSSRTNYLDTGSTYWTMSPSYATGVHAFTVFSSGCLSNPSVNYTYGVRPVINLKANVLNSGDGTVSSPFQIN